MACSFVKLTIKQTKTLIFRDRCLSLFYGVLFPLNEVQIYSRRYAQNWRMTELRRSVLNFLIDTWEVSCAKDLVPKATV